MADDLDQGDAAPVIIQQGITGAQDPGGRMNGLAGLLLEMDPDDADLFYYAVRRNLQKPVSTDRQVILGYLIRLGEVGIEVLLTVELGIGGDLTVQCHAGLDRKGEGLAVKHWKNAGETHADRAGLRIRLLAELGAAAAEDLGLGLQLGVHFQTDDHLILRHVEVPPTMIRDVQVQKRS